MIVENKIFKIFICILICFSFSITAFAAGEQPTGSNYSYYSLTGTTSYADFWSASNINLFNMNTIINQAFRGTAFWVYDGDGTHGTGYFGKAVTDSLYYIGQDLRTVISNLSTISSTLTSSNTYLSNIASTLSTTNSTLSTISSRVNTTNTRLNTTNSHLNTISGYLSDLHDIFASPEDLALKQAQENNVSAATSDFLSGSDTSTSVGSGSIGSVKDVAGDAQDFFDMDVNGTSLFSLLGDQSSDGPWIWFSDDVKNDLDSVPAQRGDVYIDFVQEKYDDLYDRIGVISENAR